MNTSTAPMKPCKQCGQPMASDAPEGLCARCLLSAAIKHSSAASGPSQPHEAPEPSAIADHFPQLEIIELLGRGGMGMVYKARQPQLERFVALKILPPADGLDPEFAQRFTREARALARLSHPNIVAVYEFGQTPADSGGLYYLLMEYVDGANLRQLLRTKTITPVEALAIVPRICEALQFAHEEGVTHRDIKPENILIDKKGRVKIADFGLAKIVGREADAFTLTQAGMSLGTPRYMAPEQLDDPSHVDHRADIYSLGVVFYEMLTGEVPMGRFAPPSAKAQVDVRLDEVVLRSLERDVERRYQHASDVKTDLDSIAGFTEHLPLAVRQMMGVEYRSPRTLWGLPLLHIAFGFNPRTGKRQVARGILAIGDNALGVVAIGGLARGVFAWGGLAIGIFSLGGLALGLVSMGGLALALGIANGGFAVGPIAWGAFAAGYLAMGGYAFGVEFAGGNGRTAAGMAAFQQWKPWMQQMFWWSWAIFVPAMIAMLCARNWAVRLGNKASGAIGSPSAVGNPATARDPSDTGGSRSGATAAKSPAPKRPLLSSVLALLFLLTFFFAVGFTARNEATAGGRTMLVTVGAFDPLFVLESGPRGFHHGFFPISWSAFALLSAGVLFSALLRIGREDAGKAPRDAMWWNSWWKQVGFWGGLLLVACIVRTAWYPKEVLRPSHQRTVPARFTEAPPIPTPLASAAPVLDERSRALETRIESALAIRGDSERHAALRTIALDAAGQGVAGSAQRAIGKMSFVEEREDTAARCARLLASRDPAGAMEIAKLIAGDSLRDLILSELARK